MFFYKVFALFTNAGLVLAAGLADILYNLLGQHNLSASVTHSDSALLSQTGEQAVKTLSLNYGFPTFTCFLAEAAAQKVVMLVS